MRVSVCTDAEVPVCFHPSHAAPWAGLHPPWPEAQAVRGHPSLQTCSRFPASLDALTNKERVRNCPEVKPPRCSVLS